MSILADLLNENYINETEGNDTVSIIQVFSDKQYSICYRNSYHSRIIQASDG